MATNPNSLILNPNPLPQINGTEHGDVLFGTDNSEQILGNGGNDIIFGKGGNDLISGGSGNDIIDGGDGDDVLSGDEGNDILLGGNGNDTLIAFGGGTDTLTGGAGDDLFSILDYLVTTPSQQSQNTFRGEIRGIKTITDFRSGQDKLEIDYGIPGSVFTPANDFKVVSSDRDAEFSDGKIVYNRSNGNLFLNTNGSAAGFNTTGTNNSEYFGGQFATLVGAPNLTAGDLSLPTGGDLATS
jgi:Ca2+-binding RTX toxin-like protein